MSALRRYARPFPAEYVRPLGGGSGATGATGATGSILANHMQGQINAPPAAPLVTGDVVALIVLPVTLSGNFLVNFPFSYQLVTADNAGWNLIRLTGPFTVNALPATPGFFLYPTVAGGTATLLMATLNETVFTNSVDVGALDPSGAPLASLVGYELTLFVAGEIPGTVTFPGASPALPLGYPSAIEVL